MKNPSEEIVTAWLQECQGYFVYAFVSERFKKLRGGQVSISGTIREWEREQELPHECVLCGTTENLSTDHLIPWNRGCDESADNLVQACQTCNSSRGDKGVFEWLGLKEKDKLHRLVAGKHLKQLLKIHEQEKTIDISVDQLEQLCGRCPCRKCAGNGRRSGS